MHSLTRRRGVILPFILIPINMTHLSADAKQLILKQYRVGVRDSGFDSLASRYDVRGGGAEILRWYRQWDGTPESLEDKPRSGRPRILTTTQVTRHIAAPIRNCNRAHRVVRYPKLLPQVQRATGKDISLRTLKRYGKEEAGGKQTRGKKRTAEECKYIKTIVAYDDSE